MADESKVRWDRGTSFIIGVLSYTLTHDVCDGEETAFAHLTQKPHLTRVFDVRFLQEQGVLNG